MLPVQNLAAETAAYLTTSHPDYAVLAARIAISNLHKETKKKFSEVIEDLYKYGKECRCILIVILIFYLVSEPEEWKTCRHDIQRDIRGCSFQCRAPRFCHRI